MPNWTGRKPCKGCGGPKPPGRGRDYCDACGPDLTTGDYYQAWEEHNKERIRAQRKAKYEAAKVRLAEFKASGCVDCGEADIRCLQIDHVDGKTMSSAGMLVCSEARREAELMLCQVRCANCHLKRHVSLDTFAEAGRKGHLKAVEG